MTRFRSFGAVQTHVNRDRHTTVHPTLPFLISKTETPCWLKTRGPVVASYVFTYLKPSYKCVHRGLELELPDSSYTFCTDSHVNSIFSPFHLAGWKLTFWKWGLWTSVLELGSRLPSLKPRLCKQSLILICPFSPIDLLMKIGFMPVCLSPYYRYPLGPQKPA